MMRCRMRGHAQQNNLSCRLAGAKKGVRFNVTPPYVRSHTDTDVWPLPLALFRLILLDVVSGKRLRLRKVSGS